MLFTKECSNLFLKNLLKNTRLVTSLQQNCQISCKNTAIVIRKYATENKNEIAESSPKKNAALQYFGSFIHTVKSPLAALSIGAAGLIPFIAAPGYLYYYSPTFSPFVITAQLAYGAVILSFLGGIRWGFYLPRFDGSQAHFSWSNGLKSTIPTIFATTALIIPDLTGGLFTVSCGLLFALYNDLRSNTRYPKWMLGLRSLLTTGAIVCLICSIILVEEQRNKNSGATANTIINKNVSSEE